MYFIKLPFILLIICLSIVNSEDNDTSLEHRRKERVSGRIVKVYSGEKPDPIVCQKEGFQADINDCSVFYRCLKAKNEKFTVFRFQCAPGTVFDIEKEVCNYPHSARRTDCRTLAIPTDEKQHDNEITNIRDELPQPIKTTQTPNNYVSPYKPVQFEYNNELPNHQDSNPYNPSSINKQDSYAPPSALVTTQINTVTQSPNILPQTHQEGDSCVANGFMGDSRNCKKFYRCVNNLRGGFIRYEFLCTDATIWDDSIQSCNHAWLARNTRCGRNNKYTETGDDTFGNKDKQNYSETSIANNLKPQNGYEQSNNIIPSQPESNRPLQNQYGTELPDNSYVSGPSPQPTLPTQIPNAGYSPVDVQYGDKIPQHVFNLPSQTYAPYVENPQIKNNTELLNTIKKYRDNCVNSGFFGYSDNCNKFYRCVENTRGAFTRYEFSCSEGTVWDDRLQACNFAWAVKECGSRKSPENDKLPSTEFPQYHTSTIENIDNESGYGPPNILAENQAKEESSYSPSSPYTSPTTSTTIVNNNIDKDYDYGYQQTINKDTMNPMESNNINYEPIKSTRNKCTKSGFVGDDTDCNKFYRCVDSGRGTFIQYEFSCGDGTVWDSRIESCNHAWAVEKCGQNGMNNNVYGTPYNTTATNSNKPIYQSTTAAIGISTGTSSTQSTYVNYVSSSTNAPYVVSDESVDKISRDDNCTTEGFNPNTEDCKKFYRCVSNGRGGFDKFDFTCGEGTAWDVSINSCNHIEYVKSCNNNYPNQVNEVSEDTTNKKPVTNDEQVSEASTTTTTATSSTTTSSVTTKPSTTTKPSPEATTSSSEDNTCSKEGYFGDKGDCKKFFRCVDDGKGGFIKYEFTCGEGTIWDTDIIACNHPQDVKNPSCSSNNAETASTSSVRPTNPPNTQPTSIVTETSSVRSTTTTKQEVTSEQITLTTLGSTSQPNQGGKQTCNEEGFYGNTDDCKSFYRCVNDGKDGLIRYDFSCGEGTIWDQDILACNHPGDVKNPSCSSESTESSKTTISDSTTAPTTAKVSTTKMSGTASTTQSTTESITTGRSTTNNPQTSSTQQTTKETTTLSPTVSSTTAVSSTENANLSTQECNDEGFFGNPDDCKKFYRCVYNGKDGYVKYDFTCGEGTVWDQELATCNHPGDVQNLSCSPENTDSSVTTSKEYPSSTDSSSTDSSSTDSSSTSKKPSSSSSGSSPSAEDNSGTTENNIDQETPAQQEKGNFTCEKAGFYPNPNDCKKFYRCVDWNNDGSSFSIFHFDCGEGTIWDPSLDTCNYEDAVYPSRNCSGTQSQGESSTVGSTTQGTSTTTESTTRTSTTTQQTTTTTQPSTESTTTTEHQTSSTEKSTTQSTTAQETSTTTTTTTTQQPTTEQTTQTDKSTEESTTTEATTQPATTEQQSTSTTEQSTSTTEQQSTSTTEQQSTSTTEQQSTSTTDQQSTSTTEQQSTSTTEQQSTSSSESTTTEGEKTTTESSQQTTESSSSNDKCPEMNEDQNAYVCPTSFRRHPTYCNLFYQCTEDENSHDLKIALFHCPNDTIYDESKTQCVNESNADKKCDGTKAQTHRIKRLTGDYVEPVTVDTRKYDCPGTGYFSFESNQECSSAFFKCQRSSNKFKGYVYKCPKGYTFWTKSKRCERMTRIKDCKQSSYPWDKRYDIPTEIRNVAP